MRPGQDPDALHTAVETGDLNQIRSLVEGNAETDARDLMGQNETPAHVCARMGNVEALEILLAHGAHVAPRDGRSMTPLLVAAAHGHADVMETLLRYGADPDQSGPVGLRALHAAIFGGHARSVNLLLEAGADVERRLCGLVKPLHIAVWSGRVGISSECSWTAEQTRVLGCCFLLPSGGRKRRDPPGSPNYCRSDRIDGGA